ncbi:shikimate dehydrogenase [Entomobacter blattae]|uniref:Shikimate dehydrogenase (NADP(+)) n=1 Tax=Entomobacter blattae TaxID=2762277 RepID=A0A7H1NSA9_9PROT|nr:shikimate dehydrogenase [Entomobacter blattae]QNT78669.1 Shikimate dehydrogenase [Entomobacter blattae]
MIKKLITGTTRVAGVMGSPVSHSLSPLIHNYWLEKYALDGVYIPIDVEEGMFEEAFRGVMACNFCGANVTIPYKEQAFHLVDTVDEQARRLGAVNILVFRKEAPKEVSKAYGFSTDGQGFWDSLQASSVELADKKVLILGAGGAARSVAGYLLSEQEMDISLSNRSLVRAQVLAQELSVLGPVHVIEWQNWQDELDKFDLLVNCTSLGMGGKNPAEIFSPDLSAAKPHLVVADIVYTPQYTPFLQAAEARGLVAIGGLGMLVYQARPAFKAWFGTMPEVDARLWDLLVERL